MLDFENDLGISIFLNKKNCCRNLVRYRLYVGKTEKILEAFSKKYFTGFAGGLQVHKERSTPSDGHFFEDGNNVATIMS
jgi:hypothetical protein